MCYECQAGRNYTTFLCVPCRKVWKIRSWLVVDSDCPSCGGPGKDMGIRWRPPRLSNTKAWRMIAAGKLWWDKRAVVRKAEKSRQKSFRH